MWERHKGTKAAVDDRHIDCRAAGGTCLARRLLRELLGIASGLGVAPMGLGQPNKTCNFRTC